MSDGFVYVVESGSGLLKIGFTNDPRRRLTMLRTSSPERLTLLGVVPGTMAHEKAIHELLHPWQVAREWFRPCRAMQPLIDGLVPLSEGRTWDIPADAHPLRAWRLSRQLTGLQVCAMIGVSKGEWSRWERGHRPIVATRVLEIEALTGVSRHVLRPDIYGPVPA